MAAGIHSAAMFFSDGTYNHQRLENVSDLHDARRLMGLHVYHVQTEDPQNPGEPDPNRLPNFVRFFNHELECMKLLPTSEVVMVRSIDTPGMSNSNMGFLREFTFPLKAPFKQKNTVVDDLPVDIARAAMDVVNFTELFTDPNFDDLLVSMRAANLGAEPVPGTGVYHTF